MHCEQCGRPLANPTAICTACDQTLSTPIGVGRYRCPACNGFFDQWTTTLLPRDARWYTPQSDVPTCPLCERALQWKRDTEPAQLPAGLQGIAMGMAWALWLTLPHPLLQGIKEHLGNWFVPLIPVLLIAMLLIAIRPSMLGTGQGSGHFVPIQPPLVGKPKIWASLIIGIAIMASVRNAPQAAQLPLWCTWLGLAAAGCLAAVLWRRSVERRKQSHTPAPTTRPPTHLS